MKRRSIACSLALAAALSATPARAGDTALAEALFREGKTQMQAGNFSEGCPKLAASYREDPGTGTLLALALCYEDGGKVASAWATYGQVAARAHAEGNGERERVAREHAAALEPRLSTLTVDVPKEVAALAGVVVKRDGEPWPEAAWGTAAPLDPGEHVLAVAADGREPWQRTVTVGADGAHEKITVGMPGVAPPPTNGAPAATMNVESPGGTQRTLAWVSFGVGTAGVLAGSALGLVSLSQHHRAHAECPATCGSQHGSDLWQSATRTGTASTIAFVVGGVGLATGAVLWFTKPAAKQRVGLAIGPASVSAQGSF